VPVATGQHETSPAVSIEQKPTTEVPAAAHPEPVTGSKPSRHPDTDTDTAGFVPDDQAGSSSDVASDRRAVEKTATVSVSTTEKPETSEASTDSEPPSPSVKQVRETPEFRDRKLSRDIGELLQSGRTDEAEARLRSLLLQQQAPQSREALARGFLVSGDYQKALDWLPEEAGVGNPNLRVLRARALLAGGNLKAAVSTLRNDIPPVQSHPEYLVTLATLLQQAGENQAAAEQWTRLLASDDSRPAWWVGLAIALESQGRLDSATRAYAEAASLPGLSPALVDYVRKRLKTLQAG
jgi:MSHA biogenesis protein MshN